MAKKKRARVFVRHRERHEWGVALEVHVGPIERTYVFADGARRVFKAADAARVLVPTRDVTDEVRERLERGVASGGTATPKALSFDFIAQIRENRDDPGPYLAYADWLQSNKDPRGELIVMDAQLAKKPRDAALRAAREAFVKKHRDYFLPKSLAEVLADNKSCSATWRFGFLSHVRLAAASGFMVPELLSHPSAEFLESLAFGSGDHILIREKLEETGHALLEEIVFESLRDRVGTVAKLFTALPNLRRAVFRTQGIRFTKPIKHAHVRSISIRANEVREIAPLLRSKLPELDNLEIDLPEFTLAPADIGMMLDGERMPKLRRLVLRNTTKTRAIVDAIVAAPHVLEKIEITNGDIPDKTIKMVLAAARPTVDVGADIAELAARWTTLACDDEIVWGERDGESAFVRAGTTHCGCSCRALRPCVHITALWDVAPFAKLLDAREVPDDFMSRLRKG